MPEFLYRVADVFDIPGRGVIATPGIPPETQGIRDGQRLELRRPDRSVVETHIASLLLVDPYDSQRPIQFLFSPEIRVQDIPIGTEVFAK
jgi:hypothetical protein